jgi:hypothetical protein
MGKPKIDYLFNREAIDRFGSRWPVRPILSDGNAQDAKEKKGRREPSADKVKLDRLSNKNQT